MENLADIDIAILTGGLGTRLKRRFPNLPKGLAPVLGRPFLTHILDRLMTFGAKRVVLCTGYLGEKIKDTLEKEYRGIQLLYSREVTPLDTGGALRLALPLFTHDTVMVLNGDSYVSANLGAFLARFRQWETMASLVLSKVSDTSRFGQAVFGDHDAILKFSEKNSISQSGWVNAGVYLFQKSIIEAIVPDSSVSLETGILPQLVGKGLKGYRTRAMLLDIGTPESFSQADHFFMVQLNHDSCDGF